MLSLSLLASSKRIAGGVVLEAVACPPGRQVAATSRGVMATLPRGFVEDARRVLYDIDFGEAAGGWWLGGNRPY
jgi:hypothetical protein